MLGLHRINRVTSSSLQHTQTTAAALVSNAAASISDVAAADDVTPTNDVADGLANDAANGTANDAADGTANDATNGTTDDATDGTANDVTANAYGLANDAIHHCIHSYCWLSYALASLYSSLRL